MYSTPEMRDFLEEAREKYGNFDAAPKVDCADLSGLEHDLVESMNAGEDRVFQAHLGLDVNATKMSLHYRIDGVSDEFTEVEMTTSGACKYTATLPGKQAKEGGVVHYYIAAYSEKGRILKSKGSKKSPNIIDITADDVPTIGTKTPLGKKPTYFASTKLGTGGAFIGVGSAETELLRAPVNCCFAPALFHLWIEAGYYLSRRLSVGGAFRMGFPIGANLDNAATGAPAGLLRVRYTTSDTGGGLVLTGSLGGGFVRQTVKLEEEQDPGMDTDTTAIGPLLVGGSLGYVRLLGGSVRLITEADLLAGLPITGEVGNARLSFGIQFDVSLGVIVAF